jgi:hypothetical protein
VFWGDRVDRVIGLAVDYVISRILVIHDPGIIGGCHCAVKIDRIPWSCWCQIPIHNPLSLAGLPATVPILVLAGCSTPISPSGAVFVMIGVISDRR